MTAARHLATLDLLRTRAFPDRRGRSDVGESGPGFHVAELSTSDDFRDDDGSCREDVEEQWEAEREGLALLLTVRWGEPQVFSLDSLLTRGFAGEHIPDPWDLLCNAVPDVHLWRVDGRWIVLGVAYGDKEMPLRLVAAVTTVDPP
ncbi:MULTISPECIES: hypothetical protein [Streptomyces]|uniref:Uncharacterized protein n=1 Tax=Streptomyces solicathayae TaxID=3081768 RepID=A0ABZ0M2M7_9ACTN|nr:hypothetical protein [Streptomyces sp. HUAS YS2]WOX25686.1 hypothetical protein R2D22_31630 [Streptomyces sp. HUAS YS2]